MYVCICNAITETQIRRAVATGTRDLWDLQAKLGVASQCGCCKETAAAILAESRSGQAEAEPKIHTPKFAHGAA